MNDEQGYVMYRGVRNTVVTYDPEKKIWNMKIVNNPKVYAQSTSMFENLLMGKEQIFIAIRNSINIYSTGPHDWTVYNDFFCSGEEGIVKISFTHCDNDQFTCNDGLCVDISDRLHQ